MSEPAEEGWQRLSPRMLAVQPLREILKFLPAIIGLLIAGTASDSGPPWWVSALAVVGACMLGVLRWFTTTYRFTADQVQLRTSLFGTKTRTARTDRVRTVDVTSDLLHRVVGLAAVKIGTGSDDSDFALDGLGRAEAGQLRAQLLHRQAAQASPEVAAVPGEQPDGLAEADVADAPQAWGPPVVEREEQLAELDPKWIRYAPFGLVGLVSAAAIFGVAFQLIEQIGFDPESSSAVGGVEALAQRLGAVIFVLVAAVALLLAVVVLSLIGYVLQNWNFKLSRHRSGGTLHVSRGLFTTRSTSLEEARLRGVRFRDPLNLRIVGGARLSAITTGLDDESSDLLLPESPKGESWRVTDALLHEDQLLTRPLRSHGPAATRRRWTRAMLGAVVVLGVAIVFAVLWSPWWIILGVAGVGASAAIAADRARSLGHDLTPGYLVSRSGSLGRATEVLERRGVIGVTIRRTFFQRRAGLADLMVTSAAGAEVYTVMDVPDGDVDALAAELLPEHVTPLLD
ncbi:PH domain-containing protein [Dermacoccaceae bacterium W4C1]